MKLCWFHLMPYTDLPDDFKARHPSVWVDIDSRLFDPVKGHRMYNEFLDELEFAAEVGFDGICVNEHHSNGYGLMPSPNLMAAALARRTSDAALVVMGNSLALYNPPLRVAEEFAMLDCLSGGRLVAGFPVGTPMDTCFAYGQNPGQLRDRYHEAHDLIVRVWTEPGPFTFHGRYNQLRYESLAASHPAGASAHLDPRRRFRRDLALVRRAGLRLLVPLVLRLQARRVDDARLLGGDGPAREGPQSVPRRFPPVRRCRREPGRGDGPLPRARGVLLQPLPARESPLHESARLHERGVAARADAVDGRARRGARRGRDGLAAEDRGLRRRGIRDRRQPRRGRRAAPPRRRRAERRPAHAAAPVQQHVAGAHPLQHRAVPARRVAPQIRDLFDDRWRTAGGRARSPTPQSRRARRRSELPSRERSVEVGGALGPGSGERRAGGLPRRLRRPAALDPF